MKKILNSGRDAGINIIKTIYNKIENKNFYKPNMSRPEIACLNTDFNLTIYKSKPFCDALFDRCIALLHHMLYLCKNEYTKENIRAIYDNIEDIETTMRTEIYDQNLQNVVEPKTKLQNIIELEFRTKLQSIIESEFRNNNITNKNRIQKFIQELKDNPDTKNKTKKMINDIVKLNQDSNKELCISISDKELNQVLGDPNVEIGLTKSEILLDLRLKRFEESIYYNYWNDRSEAINEYIINHEKSQIGDIRNIRILQKKINMMLNIIRLRHENWKQDEELDLNVDEIIKVQYYEDIEDLQAIQDSYNNLSTLEEIIEDLDELEEIEN